jgi:hypothetical protein
VRNPGGHASWAGPRGEVTCDTFTCSHCNEVVFLADATGKAKPPEECGGFCTLCMRHVCKRCSGKECRPFEKRLEEMEARGRLLAAVGV